MSWRKYFTPVRTGDNMGGSYSPFSFTRGVGGLGPAAANYSSHLPDVYVGSPNRIDRYNQYNTMDTDSEVNAALDILAEFCSETNDENGTPFILRFNNKPTNAEVTILGKYLKQWCKHQEFETRMFKIVRNVFKYGDQFFIRDPETQKWMFVDPSSVTKIIVNESEGKKPEQYVIRNVNISFENLSATPINTVNSYGPGAGLPGNAPIDSRYPSATTSPANANRFGKELNEISINAEHVVHLSLSEGLDNNYPFGNSLLETVFKVYKQKELLEDAIIIYRVQRAPERRVFYVDVGNMPSHLAMSFVERVKNEINQRRLPSATGGGTNVIDSAYNPLSINEDYFFPQTAEGRGSKVETLPGGTNLGEIDDLKYFTNKLFRGLRIPSSYLPTGADDSQAQYNDGRVGTAYIQELRFNNYCQRLQSLMQEMFDQEFKLYLYDRGVNIDSSMFELQFQPPQNFATYRQAELDGQRVPQFQQLLQVPHMSKRFAMKRFLGLTDEEMAENERLWAEENGKSEAVPTDSSGEMRSAGISQAGIESDLGDLTDEAAPPEAGAAAVGAPGATPTAPVTPPTA